jgi:ABC-type Na+ efflux pump permease subunit
MFILYFREEIMKKTKRKSWLITGLLAIALVFTIGLAFLSLPTSTMTAYAAISDYDTTNKTKSESLVYTNISGSPESGSKDNWSWSGGSQKTVSDIRYFSLSAGATLTVANNDASEAPYITHAYIRIYSYTAAQLTVSFSHGSKSDSTNYAASSDSEAYSAELIGDIYHHK